MSAKWQGDLVVLVADKNMEYSIKGILTRPEALDIEPLICNYYTHPQRDPGCLKHGVDFLRPFVNNYKHALIILDKEGCGKENTSREQLEEELEECLAKSGWHDRAAAIVIDPELEIWLWSDSPAVDAALGWQGKMPSLRTWLKEKGFFSDCSPKPLPPKKAVEEALKKVFKPRSSSIYHQIAQSVSLKRCEDPAFLNLKKN